MNKFKYYHYIYPDNSINNGNIINFIDINYEVLITSAHYTLSKKVHFVTGEPIYILYSDIRYIKYIDLLEEIKTIITVDRIK